MYLDVTMPASRYLVPVDPHTGLSFDFVYAVNTDEGWMDRHVADVRSGVGLLRVTGATERVYRHYDVVDLESGTVLAESRWQPPAVGGRTRFHVQLDDELVPLEVVRAALQQIRDRE